MINLATKVLVLCVIVICDIICAMKIPTIEIQSDKGQIILWIKGQHREIGGAPVVQKGTIPINAKLVTSYLSNPNDAKFNNDKFKDLKASINAALQKLKVPFPNPISVEEWKEESASPKIFDDDMDDSGSDSTEPKEPIVTFGKDVASEFAKIKDFYQLLFSKGEINTLTTIGAIHGASGSVEAHKKGLLSLTIGNINASAIHGFLSNHLTTLQHIAKSALTVPIDAEIMHAYRIALPRLRDDEVRNFAFGLLTVVLEAVTNRKAFFIGSDRDGAMIFFTEIGWNGIVNTPNLLTVPLSTLLFQGEGTAKGKLHHYANMRPLQNEGDFTLIGLCVSCTSGTITHIYPIFGSKSVLIKD